ncbi:MAG: M23 family metallopeptidase [Gemmatimonadota bacterium]|nr:M23 family metallopeptidase [Gemmatimonadota bacterium]MDH4349924.1 M23 family metallopeptidase [Gemmatimonadota bacterium]MDH5196011.1 M23 family metallopeptidase [Gemmatimonadota bacterium]
MRIGIAVLLATLAPTIAAGQSVQVSWHAGTPRQGTFAYVVVAGNPTPVVARGTLDSLPLAFVRAPGGQLAALAVVPLGATDSVTVALVLDFAKGRTRQIVRRLPVARARFPTERLSVDPRFTRPPDSALQARIARENARARRVTEAALATPRLWSREFVRPRPTRVTSVFGIGRVFNGRVQSRHLGTDYQGETGDPVRATNRGIVELIGDFYYAGRIVYLNHGAGLVTAYLHLSEVLVAEGDTVQAGQLLGRVGASGRVTGPHLHWMVRIGRSSADGASLLALPPLERLFDQ